MDQVELGLRKLARLVAFVWTTSPTAVRTLIALAVLACATALGYGMYGLIFGS